MMREPERRRWSRLVQVLLADAEQVRQPEARSEKYLEVAQVYLEQLQEPNRAVPYLARAAALAPSTAQRILDMLSERAQTNAIASLEDVYLELLEQYASPDVLIESLQRLATNAVDDEQALKYCIQAVELMVRNPTDPDTSRSMLVATNKRVGEGLQRSLLPLATEHLRVWPGDEVIAALKAMILVQDGRGRDAVDTILDAAAHATESRIKAQLRIRAASLFVDVLAQPLEAVNALRDALALEPSLERQARDIVDGLVEGLVDDCVMTRELVDEIIDTYDALGAADASQGVWTRYREQAPEIEWPQLYLRQAEHAETHQFDAGYRFELFLAGAQSCLGDLRLFIDGMRRATWDGAEGGFEALARLLEAEETWQELVQLLIDYAAIRPDDDERAEVTYRAGTVLERELLDGSAALEQYLTAFRLKPSSDTYAQAAERIYRAQQNWERVDGILGNRFELSDASHTKARIRLEQGLVRHRHLAQPVAAYDCLRAGMRLADESVISEVHGALGELIRDPSCFPAIEKQLASAFV